MVDGVAYVHSNRFLIAVPEEDVKVPKWPAKPNMDFLAAWREILNEEELERAHAMHVELDDTVVVKLCSPHHETHVDATLYLFIHAQYLNPNFRIGPDPAQPIGVYDRNSLVGLLVPRLT
jgi:hypothetical protein